jgi:MFS transporter, DHA2 family, multidrug resistance protein
LPALVLPHHLCRQPPVYFSTMPCKPIGGDVPGAPRHQRAVSNAAFPQGGSPLMLRIITLCSMLGVMMQSLDSTISNVALPYMQGSLEASRDQVTWVLTSYVVAAAIMTAPAGWLAARFGRKNLLITSLGGFTIASMLCGAAQTLDQMILFRILQGIFGAWMAPLSQAIMVDLYPPHKRGQTMAIFSMGVMVAPILGPTLGGYLTDTYNWRWVFYINAPFGVAAVLGILLFFHDTHHDKALKFDWFGFSVLGIAIGALQLMLDRGTTLDWFDSPEIALEAVIAGLGVYLFLVHLFLSQNPFIPRGMFEDRSFDSSLVILFVLSLCIFASTALLPPYLQNLGGYSVEQTGMLMAPRGIGSMISMFLVGRVVMRMDPRHIMAVGMTVMLCANWEMSRWTPQISATWLMATTFVQGMGTGMLFVPMSVVGFSTLPPKYRTDSAALSNLMRNMGSAIGISITSTILVNSTQIVHAQLSEHANPFNRSLALNAPSMYWNPQLNFGAGQLNAIINYNAQTIAYANDFLFIFLAGTTAFIAIYTLRRPPAVPNTDPKLESPALAME